eukprot:scaffold7352_cov254-Pinguiococcus_pyrenoidosus.AAC.43
MLLFFPRVGSSGAMSETLGLAIGLPLGVGSVVAGLVLYRCWRRRQREFAYQRVNHELDAEEEIFKAQLDGADDIDQLFEYAGTDSVDVDFDDNDLAEIEMLDSYRKALQGGAAESSEPGTDTEDPPQP